MANRKIFSTLRWRYMIALAAIALVSTGTWHSVRTSIEQQSHFSKLIRLAGQQNSLSDRIVLFATQMAMTDNAEEFRVAKAELGRALSQIETTRGVLIHGDATQDIPYVMSPNLRQIYFAPSVGLNDALTRFIKNAQVIYARPQSALDQRTPAYTFLHQYGPHVLDSLFSSATLEYEQAARQAIEDSQHMGTLLWLSLLALLVAEALLIFYPFEQFLRRSLNKLRDRNKKLKAASRSKSEFLANMSHELRTPLNAIIGFSSLLEMEVYGPFATEKQRASIQDIKYSGEHLLELINDILDMSALEVGKLKLNTDTIDLSRQVDNSWRLLQLRADEKNLCFNHNVPADFPYLRADQRRINQILLNLFTNAVKFTPDGGRLAIDACMSEMGEICLSISDTGIGMDEQDLDVALAPFGQVGNTFSRTEGGSGLGLPLTKNLIELHGGTMNIKSQKGFGTQITLVFPHDRTVMNEAELAMQV